MTKQELKATLETIIAARPIPTVFSCGNTRTTRDLFAILDETDRGYRVIVETSWSTQPKAALAILWEIRNELARIGDPTLRGAKKASTSGFWHMGRFDVTHTSREFYIAN
jgi:hypothetical protein